MHVGVNEDSRWKLRAAFPELSGYSESWPVADQIKSALSFWSGHSNRINNNVREKYKWISQNGLAQPSGNLGGHTLPDHGILLENGIDRLLSQIAERMEKEEDTDKLNELSALKICMEALSGFCFKYAEVLNKRAWTVEDAVIRERLLISSKNMEVISGHVPENLLQAMQLLYFSHLMDQLDNMGDAASFGRVDQLLIGFYEKDLKSGSLTRKQAYEMVCHFILKNWKPQSSCNMTIGGVKRDGNDGTNLLSYIFLEAMGEIGLPVDMTVRIHKNCPEDFYHLTAYIVRKGLGRPDLYNDDVTVEALIKKGVEREDARDYAPLGCVEVMIPGLSCFRTMGLGLQPLKIFELVINKGCQGMVRIMKK